jgi:hypothetical protein
MIHIVQQNVTAPVNKKMIMFGITMPPSRVAGNTVFLPLSRFLYVANIDAPSILNYKPF